MAEYQVLARKYRPKTFKEVLGQDSIVQTLKNALKFHRLAHAYLFCGSRGTGKTTLARIFAKSLNCEKRTQDGEPCCSCTSCLEIATGSSIDVLEIDGASHRGIDDIRTIADTVGYAPAQGKYKIYIIDEVHMLTKEAFNALLKTLEEPPAQVKFFFATTEPHKLPETILSRCQRFNLKRISLPGILQKLSMIAKESKIDVEEEALIKIAQYVEGGLRDAESLFDQIISFANGKITQDTVHDVLGTPPQSWFFALDKAFHEADLKKGLEIASDVYMQGKDMSHFIEDLREHFRSLLLIKLSCLSSLQETSASQLEALQQSAKLYTQEQCLTILDLIVDAELKMKSSLSQRMALETLLLRILRQKHRLPIEYLVRRLSEIEKTLSPQSLSKATPETAIKVETPPLQVKPAAQEQKPQEEVPPNPRLEILPSLEKKTETPPAPIPQQTPPPELDITKKSRYDTLIQFAAVELEGTVLRTTDTRRK